MTMCPNHVPDLTARQLHAVLSVAEYGSFIAAAALRIIPHLTAVGFVIGTSKENFMRRGAAPCHCIALSSYLAFWIVMTVS